MKQRYISLMLSVVTLFLSAGVLFVYGQNTYVGPSAPFPSGLVDKPVDTSNAGQEKSGDLNLKTLRFGLNTDSSAKNVTLSGRIGHASVSDAYIDLGLGTLGFTIANNSGPITLVSRGLTLPKFTPTAGAEGMIYYDSTGDGKVKLYNKTGWTDIGTGSGVATSTFAPTVKINGDSGSKGLLLNMTGTEGENSPMIMFAVYGNAPVSMFSDEKIAKSFLENFVPKANAMLPECDPEKFACGGGGGGGGGYIDPLTQPIWWMRQEGTKFVIKASNPSFSDVREVFELTKAGSVSAAKYYERRQNGEEVDVSPSGTMCGFRGRNGVIWRCNGMDPIHSCPKGYYRVNFGSDTWGGVDGVTCVKS